MRVGLAAGSERLDGRLRVGRGDMAIHRLHGTVRAGRLQEWLDLPLVLEGGIHVDLAALTLDSGQGVTEADGAVLWSGAAAGLPRAFPLGEYRATLEAREGSVLARIESAPDSPLEVSGIAGWMPIDNSYRVDLEARLDSSADAALRGALDSLARSQPDGSYRIVLGGASRAPDRRAAPPTVRAYDTEELDAVTPP